VNVPFLDLGAAYRELKSEIDQAVHRVLDSGWYILGPEVTAFEKQWAEFCDAKHAVGLANGLDALTLSLRVLGVGPGDEVIVPSNTYVATWLAVSAVGGKIVPVEPDPATHNIDPERIAAAITDRTKVILPVHLYGQPADMDPILALAKQHKLFVVEDGAQSHGAKYKGKRIGAHGDIVCWSFYPGKNLGALGDGGAVTTDNPNLAEKIRVMANYGSQKKYENQVIGCNSRLDPIQAAVLSVKLDFLDEWTQRRISIAQKYEAALQDSSLVLPHVPDWADPAWHLYVVRSKNRAHVQKALAEKNIGTLIHYPIPPHMQKAYADLALPPDAFPIARDFAQQVVSLPMGPQMTQEQQNSVCTALRGMELGD
jgi:dTDP-4-amino-4,6-dideoxygalactose transaminase